MLAVAGLGYSLLTGKIDLRRAGQVVLGIFILFGAPVIVGELMAGLRGDVRAMPDAASSVAEPPPALKPPSRRDPYAGASLPE